MSDDADSPPEREMKDFQFRQMKKARVFESPEELPKDRSSLLTISNQFDLTFVGLARTFKVYLTQDILAADKADGSANEIIEGIPALAEVTVELTLHHLALSCDELTLSVCGISDEEVLSLTFYDVRTFMNKNRPQKLPFASLQPGVPPNTFVHDLKWNPVTASMLAVCLSDGSMIILEVGGDVQMQAILPASKGITSICWSPKGKQIAAGKMDATVSQYTPALEEKKVIPCPNFYTSDNPAKVLDVLWLRTFVFAVVYAAADGSPETPPDLVVVSLPKKDEKVETKYLNFSDPVYGSCTERQHHYLLSHIEDWDLVFAASAASIEVSVVARQDDKNWELWVLEDASRAELPVSDTSDDTFPLGLAIDFTSQQDIYITDEKIFPPAPTMLLLSTQGLLCPFALLNLNPGVKQLVSAPKDLSLEGERLPKPGSVTISHKAAPSIPSGPAAFPTLCPASAASTPPATVASSSAPFSIAPISSSSFTFSVPSTCATSAPSAFSLSGSTIFGSGASGFSFASKPPSDTPSALSAFSFSAPSTKPLPVASTAPAPQSIAVATPPTMKPNFSDRFSAESTTPATQPFSFISSAPKTIISNASSLTVPSVPATKPPAVLAPVRPVQSSTPAPVVQKPTPTAQAPAQAPAQIPQATVGVKSLEKQLQQKKDSDPIMAGIVEEIVHFQKEIDDLKARSARADFKVGSSEEMKELRKESENLHVFTLEIKETTESLHGDIGTLKTSLLEGFAGAEEAKAQSELSRDRNYRHLLYKRPLDPRSEEQLKEIRRLYQYVTFAVEDVNDVLDVEWEKHLEKKKKQKHMVIPGREGLFTTLSNNRYIINQQKNRLDQLVKELTSLHLYNKSQTITSNTAATTSCSIDAQLENLRDALLKAKLDSSPKDSSKSPAAKISPVKQSQLRNFLSKGQMPPVRSTAPANLSRSAFLSPKYYEDLDDVSSASSLSQSLDPHHLELEEEEEEEELQQEPLSMPVMTPALSTPRHPTVVRTPSILPGFGAIQSTPLVKPHSVQGMGFGLSPIASLVPSNKINLCGADSTALATKTVKHGAPPLERTAVTVSAKQAAATAALRRQMANQKPGLGTASLTESTLKTVPQVVNVQELKDKAPPAPVSSVISSSVPDPAAQAMQQVLTSVSSNQAKRTPTQVSQKISTEGASSFVFGISSTVASSTAADQNNSKGFSFPATTAHFSFTSVAHGAGNSQVKDPFSFGSSKAVFGSTAEEPFSLTPKSTSPAFGTGSPSPAPNGSSETTKPSSSQPALRTETQTPKIVGGETLGNFTGIRVGQGEAKDSSSKPTFSFGESGPEAGKGPAQFSFGTVLQMSTEESTATDLSKDSLFKPPEATTTLGFSVPQPTTASSASPTSFIGLLATPSPSESSEETKAPALPSEPTPPPEKTTEAQSLEPRETSEPATDAIAIENGKAPLVPVPDTIAPIPTPAVETPQTPARPIIDYSTAAVPVPASDGAPVSGSDPAPLQMPSSDSPGSIFTQPLPATTDSTTIGVSPVINTIATAGTTPTHTTANTETTTAVTVFGQPAATPASSTPSVPSAPPPTAFGSSGFGSATGTGFGQPIFGQVSGFGQPVSNTGTSGGFSFAQTSFGSSSNSTSSGGALFGASTPTASNASSFSFGSSNTNTASSTGAGLFGSSTAAPTFGQNSGFGQGSVFGSNTTTSSASGFSFGQPSAFGCSSATPVFGQQASTGSIFGQQSSSGGGLFGSCSANTTGSSTGGGFFSGLGGKPSEDAANKNPFGSTASTGGFGQPAQTGGNSLFGNSGAKTFGFGQTTFGEQKPSGTFSSGGGSVASQGFGSFSTPTKPGGFGSAPVFGSPPAFGSSPAFGSAAAFGAGTSFSSPLGSSGGKVFGEGTAASSMGGFGFASPSSAPSFGALANQSAPSFGSIAQQGSGFGSQPSSFSGFGQQQGGDLNLHSTMHHHH